MGRTNELRLARDCVWGTQWRAGGPPLSGPFSFLDSVRLCRRFVVGRKRARRCSCNRRAAAWELLVSPASAQQHSKQRTQTAVKSAVPNESCRTQSAAVAFRGAPELRRPLGSLWGRHLDQLPTEGGTSSELRARSGSSNQVPVFSQGRAAEERQTSGQLTERRHRNQ